MREFHSENEEEYLRGDNCLFAHEENVEDLNKDDVDRVKLINQMNKIIDIENKAIVEGFPNFYVRLFSKHKIQKLNVPDQIGTHGDCPTSSETTNVHLTHNDIVILGTDGFFDNLYLFKILETLEKHVDCLDPELISSSLVDQAYSFANSKNYISPFSLKYYSKEKIVLLGGKNDDICISMGIAN